MLQEYIEAAMSKAAVASPGEDGLFVGTFPDMPEVPAASDADAEECLKKLRQNFEEWILFRVTCHLTLPDINELSISYHEIRNRPTMLDRLHHLESELQRLVVEVERPRASRPFRSRLGAAAKMVNEYWALFSVAGAIIAVVIILMMFGVSPFEEYRKIQINRGVSEVYSNMGDRLLSRGEYELAKTQYKAALAIYPNNLAALEGTFKSQVLDPVEGESHVRKNVLNTRLDSLKSFKESEYLVDFYTGVNELNERNYDKAREALSAAVEKNRYLARAYVQLGVIALEDGCNFNAREATEQFAKADTIGKDDIVNNGEIPKYFLGYSRMLRNDFRQADKDLSSSINISERVDTAYALGDTLRYLGNFEDARARHLQALRILSDDKNANEDSLSEETLCNFAPEHASDETTVKRHVIAHGFKEFRILIHYALSLDYVLGDDLKSADAELKSARDLDANHVFDSYIKNRIDSMNAFLNSAGFHDATFKNPARLADKLRFGSDSVSQLLAQRLSPATRRLLGEFNGREDVPEPLRYALVNDFNLFLGDAALADDFHRMLDDPEAKRFLQGRLTKETADMLRRRSQGEDMRRLNWALLAESYPTEIVKRLDDEQKRWLERQSKAFTPLQAEESPCRTPAGPSYAAE